MPNYLAHGRPGRHVLPVCGRQGPSRVIASECEAISAASWAEIASSRYALLAMTLVLGKCHDSSPHIRDGSQSARMGNAIRITRRIRSVTMKGSTPLKMVEK